MFGIYGEIVENNDNTITLKPEINNTKSTAGSTYFEETDRNYDWVEGGMAVNFKVYVDSEALTNGEYTVWSLALNEKYVIEADEATGTEASEDINYLTELPVFFVGTNDGVKFIYSETGVDQDDYVALVNTDEAVTLSTGSTLLVTILTLIQTALLKLQLHLKTTAEKKFIDQQTTNSMLLIPHNMTELFQRI